MIPFFEDEVENAGRWADIGQRNQMQGPGRS